MDRALEDHRRYLIVSRDMCARNPLAHSHQLAALEREIAIASTAESSIGFRVASGDSFELTRAAWLDRIANHARVASLVGDRWKLQAAALEYACAVEAKGHEDWQAKLANGATLGASVTVKSSEAAASFTRVLLGLLRLSEEHRPPIAAECRAITIDAFRGLRGADPTFT